MKTVCIVGNHDSGHKAPFYQAKDIWLMNDGFLKYPRCDLLFDMHNWNDAEYVPSYYLELLLNSDYKHLKLVKPTFDIRLIQNQTTYPIDKARHIFGDYLKCSASLMLAYAYMSEFNRIEIYGITREHFKRNSLEGFSFYYMLGHLLGRQDNEIYIHEDCDFFDIKNIYGYYKLELKNIIEEKELFKS